MKSGTAKFKVEGRRSLSRHGGINGDAAVVRPSALCDHLYATEDMVAEKMQLHEMVKSRLDMIGHWHEEQPECPLFDEQLPAGVVKGRPCLLRCRERAPPQTRYIGRKSKTVPSRALKRRYICPPKPQCRHLPPLPEEANSALPLSAAECPPTDKEYFPPKKPSLPPQDAAPLPHIDVPSWKWKPVTSFYQMEGTENLNDATFERRHQKYQLDERRRKRWDLQRLREQKARNERQRKKREREEDTLTFFPDPQHAESIDVIDEFPVMAFGQPIPVLQPCEFSLCWSPQAPKRGRRGRPLT